MDQYTVMGDPEYEVQRSQTLEETQTEQENNLRDAIGDKLFNWLGKENRKMKITAEYDGETIILESENWGENPGKLRKAFKTIMYWMGYHPGTIDDWLGEDE